MGGNRRIVPEQPLHKYEKSRVVDGGKYRVVLVRGLGGWPMPEGYYGASLSAGTKQVANNNRYPIILEGKSGTGYSSITEAAVAGSGVAKSTSIAGSGYDAYSKSIFPGFLRDKICMPVQLKEGWF